jgi:hypothetical protein
MEHYTWLDVSLQATAVCVIDKRGRVVIESKVPCADSNGRRNVTFSSTKILIQGLGGGPPSKGFSRP